MPSYRFRGGAWHELGAVPTPPSTPQIVATATIPVAAPSVATTLVRPGANAGSDDPTTLSYTVPAGAIFVSPTGNDANGGTLAAPLKTWQAANTAVASGGTIVLRGGEYHVGTTVPLNGTGYSVNNTYACVPITKTNVTVQPYPGEKAVLDGSSIHTGWTQSGAVWSKAIVQTMDRSATDSYGKLDNDSRGIGWLWVRGQQWHDLVVAAGATEEQAQMFPLASWPERVWIDGVQQTQVATLAEVGPGEFFVEGTASGTNGMLWTSSRYHLGTDPTNKEVRVTDLCTAVSAAASGVTIKGLTVQRYGASINMGGVVKLRATNCTLEQMTVQDSSATGVEYFSADGATIRKSTVTRNGNLGIKSSGCYNLTFDRVKGTVNNNQRFNWAPVSGAVKITTGRNITHTGCDYSNNWTKGLWYDVSCYDLDHISCAFDSNEQFGAVFEISSTGVVANCSFVNNGKHGLMIQDTTGMRVWNNTIQYNGRLKGRIYDSASPRNVVIYQDDRRSVTGDGGTYPGYGRDGRQPLPDPTMNNWVIESMEFGNNIIGQHSPAPGGTQFAYYVVESLEGTGSRDLSSWGLTAGGNLFTRASATDPTWAFLKPLAGGAKTILNDLPAWRAASSQDLTSTELIGPSPTDSSGMLTTAGNVQYGPGGASNPAIAMPADIAALIGVPASTRQVGIVQVANPSNPPQAARLKSGTTAAPQRLTIVGDSIAFGAAQFGATPPKYLNSWPGKLRASLVAGYGDAGTGLVLFNQDLWPITTGAAGNTGWDPRVVVTGTITEPGLGFHGHGVFTIPDGGTSPTAYVELTANCTEFSLGILPGTSGVVRYSIDGAATKTAQNVASGGAAVDIPRQLTGSAQHNVLRIPAGAAGVHTIRFWGDGGTVTAWGWNARTAVGRIIVDNASISGRSLGTFLSSTAGRDGLAFLDTIDPDVALICLGTNDYNAAVPLATAQANLTTVINRVKANGGVPLVYFPPQSSPTLWPGGTAATYTQYANGFGTTCQSLGVGYLNLQKLWGPTQTTEQAIFDAGVALGKYADNSIHPNDSGAADIAAAVRTFLAI